MIRKLNEGLIIETDTAGMFVPTILFTDICNKIINNMTSFKLMFLSFSVDKENNSISISDDVETITIELSELTPWFEM